MRLEAMIFRILCAKNYDDRFKLLHITEENPVDIFKHMVYISTDWLYA